MGAVGGCLEEPHLQQVQATPSKVMIGSARLSKATVAEQEHDNQKELERLRVEQQWLKGMYAIASAALGVVFAAPGAIVAIAGFFGGGLTGLAILQRTQKVAEILRTADALIELFSDREIQIFPDVALEGRDRLDLWVKFPVPPKKTIFAISFRSKGKAKIIYRESKEEFYAQRHKRGLRLWNLNIFERMSSCEAWLRQSRQAEFFGTSSKDRNRSVVKILVLTSESTIGQHPESAYTMVGEQKVLLIKKRSSIYVLEEKQLMTFIKDWVALNPETVSKS